MLIYYYKQYAYNTRADALYTGVLSESHAVFLSSTRQSVACKNNIKPKQQQNEI